MDLGEGLTCLLIEDNLGDARLIQYLLDDADGARLSFTHVTSLAPALDLLRQESFDVILLDLTLPDSNGLETLEIVHRTRADIAIVVLTGIDATDIAIGAVQRGAQDYLVKGRGDGQLIKRSLLYAVERQRANQRLLLAEAAFRAIDTGIMVTDAAGKVVRVNPAFCRVTGFENQEVVGTQSSLLRTGIHEAAFYEALWQQLRETGAWEGEIWTRRKHGEVTPEWLRINVVHDDSGGTAGYVAIFSDITFRRHAEQDLLRQATTDPLTGLGNRQLFQRLLASTIEQATRYQREAALLFLDLDGFKDINDSAGHAVGDTVLREVAARLRGAVRISDEVSRLGGDEFVVILPEVRNRDAAEAVATKLLQEITHPFDDVPTDRPLTASIGIAMIPDNGDTNEALIEAADAAMYAAKRSGKNTVRFYSKTLAARHGQDG
ncbi:diguanylate cyclase domain-containing protein [Roseospira visakhapatnamensis]|uniref:Diguanylate cyclase (GGDEF)-like protein/PAS domain S-box-containing protein n=1 Tax=Roseospira visakhapatnamensis TaxID=390880 RepID=A0A7W6RAL3_9PROT|nr:diguanylate cyclase [Roseospira visakhapatnamensis]MBB4264952.1 diguanylate cyclase (GGDEF)-like protein/PAS domain S-box-containing protein [Roseospira visakhapatnamensis]